MHTTTTERLVNSCGENQPQHDAYT